MFLIIKLLFKNTFKHILPNKLLILTDIFSAFLTVFIYAMTSKALNGHFEKSEIWHHTSYLNFVLIAEITLNLPLLALESVVRSFKIQIIQGTFTQYLFSKKGPAQQLFIEANSFLPRELIGSLTLYLTGVLLFEFNLSAMKYFIILTLQILALPAFLSAGLFVSATILKLGRGFSLAGQISFLLMVLAGTYFPAQVLPKIIYQLSIYLSVPTMMVNFSRSLAFNNEFMYTHVFIVISIGLFTLPFSIYIFNKVLTATQKSGQKQAIPI